MVKQECPHILTEFHCYKKLKILCKHSVHSDCLTRIFEYVQRRHHLISRIGFVLEMLCAYC